MKKLLLALFLLLTGFIFTGCNEKATVTFMINGMPNLVNVNKGEAVTLEMIPSENKDVKLYVDKDCTIEYDFKWITKDTVIFIRENTIKLDMSLIEGLESTLFMSQLVISFDHGINRNVEKITEAYRKHLLDIELTHDEEAIEALGVNYNLMNQLYFYGDKYLCIRYVQNAEGKATILISVDNYWYISKPYVFDAKSYHELADS